VTLGEVSGIVTMNGSPLADVVVVFTPEKGNPSSGRTDASGKYVLFYRENAEGAIVGSHKVSITSKQTFNPSSKGESEIEEAIPIDSPTGPDSNMPPIKLPAGTFKKESIPTKYNTKTELKADVIAGENTFDFDLKSK
tara:strand:+ start:9389 stop:9802 length:414 start_codon:yes stop_codon:yes gene_type:complete